MLTDYLITPPKRLCKLILKSFPTFSKVSNFLKRKVLSRNRARISQNRAFSFLFPPALGSCKNN